MECISSTTMSLARNGDKLPAFIPMRGLQQGDPLSPYLFVLCMEVLGQNINNAVTSKAWRQICMSRTGPTISHFF